MADVSKIKVPNDNTVYNIRDINAARKTRYPSGNHTDETIKNFEEGTDGIYASTINGKAGWAIVYTSPTNGAGTRKIQTVEFSDGDIYTRFYNGTTWGEWNSSTTNQEQVDWNTNNGVKNLLDCIKDGYLYPYSGYGITVIVDKKAGTATINGTATRQLTFFLQKGSLDTSMAYRLTGCPTNGNYASTYAIYAEDSSGTSYAIDDGTGVIFTPRTNHSAIRILIRANATLNNLVFKPMLRPAFIEDNTFEPYAEPNPTLTTAKNYLATGEGKNLVRFNKGQLYIKDGIQRIFNTDGSITVSGTATARTHFHISTGQSTGIEGHPQIEPGTYVLSGCTGGNYSTGYFLEIHCDGLSTTSKYLQQTTTEVEFTVTKKSDITLYFVVSSGYSFSNAVTIYPMIRKKEFDSTFVPHYDPYQENKYYKNLTLCMATHQNHTVGWYYLGAVYGVTDYKDDAGTIGSYPNIDVIINGSWSNGTPAVTKLNIALRNDQAPIKVINNATSGSMWQAFAVSQQGPTAVTPWDGWYHLWIYSSYQPSATTWVSNTYITLVGGFQFKGSLNCMTTPTTPPGTSTLPAFLDKKIFSQVSLTENGLGHNGKFRGQDLTGLYTIDELYQRVHNGSFNDIYLGDYFNVSITTDIYEPVHGIVGDVTYYLQSGSYPNWTYTAVTNPTSAQLDTGTVCEKTTVTESVLLMVAGFDYYLNTGDTKLTDHHMILIPRSQGFTTTAHIDNRRYPAVHYANSALHQTVLPCYAKSLKTALNSHVLSHRTLLRSGSATSFSMTWSSTDLQLMTESQVFGCAIHSDDTTSGNGLDNKILPVFNFIDPQAYATGDFWLRNFTSGSIYVNNRGALDVAAVTGSSRVRPIIVFG